MLQRYADMCGAEVSEVVEFVEKYVNGPWNYPVEPTEQSRLASIKGYIEQRLMESPEARIKYELAASRLGTLETAPCVQEAPF